MTLLLAFVSALTVSSRIDTVFVYANQVVVLRTARVALSGSDELVFPELPGALDDNSIRIRAPGVRIGAVQVRRGYLAEPTPEVKRLENRLRALEDSVKMLEDESLVLRAKEEFLASVKLGAPELIARELSTGRVAPDAWRNALTFLGEELTRVKVRQLTLYRTLGEVIRRRDAARQELEAARAVAENRKEIRFTAEAEPGSYPITLAYALPRAAEWQPYYELRANPGAEQVEFNYFARLTQRTGENWEDVKLVLSTATPVRELHPPEPQPWYLTLLEETYRAKTRRDISGVAEARFEAAPAPGGEEIITPIETGISLQYVIPGRVSIKSGEPPKKLPLKRVTLPGRFEHYTLPRALEKAFLTAQLVNSSDLIFLSGEASTYVGEEFTGTTTLPTLAPQESLNIGFGLDERVKVKRELVRTFKSRTGLLSRTERVQFVYRITLENYHPKPVRVKLIEQVPVSQQKEIKVTITRLDPRPEEQDENLGTLTYHPEVPSGGRFELNLEFQVEYPAGRRVAGLY